MQGSSASRAQGTPPSACARSAAPVNLGWARMMSGRLSTARAVALSSRSTTVDRLPAAINRSRSAGRPAAWA
ncbi:hypothetical protein ACFQ4K_08615 [Tistrella bauzanensis]